ncbi:Putative RNA-binding protein Luc7-like 1 [Sparganum proliferum]
MSATDQVRSLLDELMGTSRDGGRRRIEFDDPRRMDLGECPYTHEVGLKSDYRREAEKRPYYYEVDALRHLEKFVADCNRRTDIAKSKLRETQEELTDEAAEQIEAINKLSEEIGTTLAKAEQKGADGHVEESLKLMAKVEELNALKAKGEADLRNAIPVSTYQQQKLRVCDVCSAYLGVHDNDRRLADHFGGKLHLGFITIREKLEALREYVTANDLIRKQKEAAYPRDSSGTTAETVQKHNSTWDFIDRQNLPARERMTDDLSRIAAGEFEGKQMDVFCERYFPAKLWNHAHESNRCSAN